MNVKKTLFIVLLSLAALWGCTPAPGSEDTIGFDSPRVWFDAPEPGTVNYPPNPCVIVAHGASPFGIAVFELLINGVPVSVPSPDTGATLATLTRDCVASEPGVYALQLRAQDNSGTWSGYAQTYFILSGEEAVAPTPRATVTPVVNPTALPGDTATPTQTQISSPTPTPQPAGDVVVESVSTNLVYLGGTTCGTNEVTILARASAPNGINVVVLFYRFQTANASSPFQNVAMTPIGGGLFEKTLNPTTLLGSVPFDMATLEYQIVVQQDNDDTSIRTPVLADISIQACGGGTAACSTYTSQDSCETNSCIWVEIPGIVPIYECRAP